MGDLTVTMTRRKHSLGAVMGLACLTGAAFAIGFEHPLVSDAVQYDRLGWNLAQGHGFSLADAPPYEPTMFREPLYPAFLAGIYQLVGHRPDLVPFWQIPCLMVTCWLVFALGSRLFSPQIGWWAALMTAGIPVLANYPSYLLTETCFTLLLVASTWAMCRAWATRRGWWWAASGALMGLATLCRAVAAPVVALCAVVALAAPDLGYPRARRAAHVAALLLCCGAVIAPWMIRNHHRFGVTSIALRGEMALRIRAHRLDDRPDQILQMGLYSLSEYVGHQLFPDAAANPRDVILGDSHLVSAREQELMAAGLSRVEANQLFGQEAWELIRRHPVRYLLYSPIEMIKLTAFSYVPSLNEAVTINRFERLPHGRALLALLRGVIRLLAYPLLALVGYGLWVERRHWRRWWPLGVVIAYMNLVHALLVAEGRYAVPLVPLYLVVAMAGVAAWQRRSSGALPRLTGRT